MVSKQLRLTTSILLAASGIIFIIGLFPNVVLSYYSKGFYPVVSVALRWISSWFPFALGDILYGILIIFGLIRLFFFFKKLQSKEHRRALLMSTPLRLLNLILILYMSFKLLWGLNYSRPSISQQLHISDEKYTVKELALLTNYFVDRLNTLQQIAEYKPSTIQQLQAQAVLAYGQLAQKNAFFSYPAPSVKPVLNSWAICKIGIEGYYNPLSGEANINTKLPAWVLPFVTCHEISHQLGVAREDEANLVAYLVGSQSEDADLQYSVYYNMLRYLLFELRFKSPEDYLALRNKIDPRIIANFKAENKFWSKYNGQMSNYMGAAFDKFLKLNNQQRGIKSYQNIVIWLWNIHKKQLSTAPHSP
ncbi:DUF3810 domain-containing protein [Pedobacter sp. KR3-3]|uniref:DUF3810 domain-containing protein n=1 Tax=Pedobacter albus TaxID=3113905 RepID=A0ABU7I678_9SPHI|nr:DUF3810 domain-containing protein [Pedobacter sp. KR3-3]MEE1944983.1 DUF3810 domain-containing protein [Pedobacter sp. KR3-3]